MEIFIVHRTYSEESKEYILFCCEQTAASNPGTPITYISESFELLNELNILTKKLPNLTPVHFDYATIKDYANLISASLIECGVSKESGIFHVFLNSILRHIVIAHYIKCSGNDSPTKPFIVSDSDIAHYFDLSSLTIMPNPSQYMALGPDQTYFSAWGPSAHQSFSNIEFLKAYLKEAIEQQQAPNDIFFLRWIKRNAMDLEHIGMGNSYLGLPLDPALNALSSFGLWAYKVDNIDQYIIQYPGGLWGSKTFLDLFDKRLLKQVLVDISTRGSAPRLYLNLALIKESMLHLESHASQAPAFQQNFNIYKSILSRCHLQSNLLRVPYVHFQGNSKKLVNSFIDFINE